MSPLISKDRVKAKMMDEVYNMHDGKKTPAGSKKPSKAMIAVITVVLVLLLLIIIGVVVGNHYLNKIDIDTDDPSERTTLQVDPEVKEEENNLKNKIPQKYVKDFDTADEAIAKNIKNGTIWYHKDVYNLLLIGSDTRNPQYYSRSDSMILISVNKQNQQVKMVSLLRAAYVNIPGHGNARLNAAYSYGGPQLLIDTIEQNYKIHIDNYISVDFTAFRKIVDILGGIDMQLTDAEAKALAGDFAAAGLAIPHGAGKYHMDGATTLKYVRLRSIDSDRNRTQRQRNVLNVIINKAKSMNINQGLQLLDEILPLVKTDMSKSTIISQAANAMRYIKWNITQDTIPHTHPKLVNIDGTEVLLLDWDQTVSYIHNLLYPGLKPQKIPA